MEATFGSEFDDDRFIIADPLDICVSDDGDIMVTDERIIKIYEKNGKQKEFLGVLARGRENFNGLAAQILAQQEY